MGTSTEGTSWGRLLDPVYSYHFGFFNLYCVCHDCNVFQLMYLIMLSQTQLQDHTYPAMPYQGNRKYSLGMDVEEEPLTPSEKDVLVEWKGVFSKNKHFRKAIFVLGPMCSGKTTTIREFKRSEHYEKYAV